MKRTLLLLPLLLIPLIHFAVHSALRPTIQVIDVNFKIKYTHRVPSSESQNILFVNLILGKKNGYPIDVYTYYPVQKLKFCIYDLLTPNKGFTCYESTLPQPETKIETPFYFIRYEDLVIGFPLSLQESYSAKGMASIYADYLYSIYVINRTAATIKVIPVYFECKTAPKVVLYRVLYDYNEDKYLYIIGICGTYVDVTKVPIQELPKINSIQITFENAITIPKILKFNMPLSIGQNNVLFLYDIYNPLAIKFTIYNGTLIWKFYNYTDIILEVLSRTKHTYDINKGSNNFYYYMYPPTKYGVFKEVPFTFWYSISNFTGGQNGYRKNEINVILIPDTKDIVLAYEVSEDVQYNTYYKDNITIYYTFPSNPVNILYNIEYYYANRTLIVRSNNCTLVYTLDKGSSWINAEPSPNGDLLIKGASFILHIPLSSTVSCSYENITYVTFNAFETIRYSPNVVILYNTTPYYTTDLYVYYNDTGWILPIYSYQMDNGSIVIIYDRATDSIYYAIATFTNIKAPTEAFTAEIIKTDDVVIIEPHSPYSPAIDVMSVYIEKDGKPIFYVNYTNVPVGIQFMYNYTPLIQEPGNYTLKVLLEDEGYLDIIQVPLKVESYQPPTGGAHEEITTPTTGTTKVSITNKTQNVTTYQGIQTAIQISVTPTRKLLYILLLIALFLIIGHIIYKRHKAKK